MAKKSSSKTESRKLSAAERRELKAKRKADRKATKAEARKQRRKNLWDRVRGATGGSDIVVIVMVLLFSFFGIAMVFSAGYYQTINTASPNPFYYLIRQGIFAVVFLPALSPLVRIL